MESEITIVSQLIGSVGFPIAACIYMFYLNNQFRISIDKFSDAMSSVKDAIKDLEIQIKTIGVS